MEASLLIRLIDELTGPAAKVKKGLQGITEAASGMKQGFAEAIKEGFSVENIENATRNAEQALNKSRQRLMGAVGTALALLGPAKMAGDFDEGMRKVGTLIDTTAEPLDHLKREVLDISERVPVALSDLSTALYDVRSAGVKAADQFNVLEGSARLAVAGQGNTASAVDLVTSAINAFNLEGEKQAGIYDVIFKTVKNGKTTIDQLARGFGGTAGVVANAGVEIDEYLASVAALTTTGLPAAEAHTQLKATISGLTRETADSKKLFDALGADSFKDLIDKSGGMVNALTRIREQLGGDDAALLKLVGSTDALNSILGLTGAQGETFRATLDDMRNGANAIDPAFDEMAGGFNAQWKMMMNSVSELVIILGNQLLPVLIEVVNEIKPIVSAVTDWMQANPELAKTLVLAVAGMMAFSVASRLVAFALAGVRLSTIRTLSAFLKFDAAGKNVATGWRLLAGTGSLLTGAFNLIMASAGGIVTALAGISAPIWGLIGLFVVVAAAIGIAVYKYWEPISNFFVGFGQVVAEAISTAMAAIGGFVVDRLIDVGKLFGIEPAEMEAAIGKAQAEIQAKWDGLVTWLWELPGQVGNWMGGLFKMEDFSDEEEAGFKDAGRRAGQAVVDAAQAAIGLAKSVFDITFGLARGNIDPLVDWLHSVVDGIVSFALSVEWPAAPEWLTWLMGKAGDAVNAGTNAIAEGLGSLGVGAPGEGFNPLGWIPAFGGPPQEVETKIAAEVVDKRPPTVNVNAPITVQAAADPKATGAAVAGAINSQISQARTGALHDGVD